MNTGELIKIINNYQESLVDAPRNYIGASIIGSDCLRQIWYEFKGFKGETISPKLRRIFNIGKKIEEMLLELLSDAGVVFQRDVFYQDKEIVYFQGHADAVLTNMILEIKSAKDSEFNKLLKEGLKKWNPRYYAQIQSYMGMSGIPHAAILVLNKDNSEIYDEMLDFDNEYFEFLRSKVQVIGRSLYEPPRISGSPAWYQCKTCKFRKVCHDL